MSEDAVWLAEARFEPAPELDDFWWLHGVPEPAGVRKVRDSAFNVWDRDDEGHWETADDWAGSWAEIPADRFPVFPAR